METHEQQVTEESKLPLWIIEYIWAHQMADVLQDVDPSAWPELDSQPLSLEDSGRLRVISAKVYSIVKNRDIEHFERVLKFLEETHRLLPSLVAAIKHMKIAFGLKTLIILWMLKQKREMIDIMFKINLFFPSRLPQYQNQCTQHELFLMKKNHMDFKSLAQSLAMDKGMFERYATNQMQQQYGEHYAQKVEDRLLQYLQKLETVLPGDAYIDKILKKESPVNEEEKLLLEVVSSDSATIAATLKKLLHCEVTFLDLGKELLKHPTKALQLSKSPLRATSSGTREEPADLDVLRDSPLLLENEQDLEDRCSQQSNGRMTERGEKESCEAASEQLNQEGSEEHHEGSSSPQFCSKHQRWVKTILEECPEDRPDDISPPLFQSSSSHTSSEDLTPSGLQPGPADQHHPPSDTSGCRQTPKKTREKASPTGHMTSGTSPCDGSKSQLLLQPQVCVLSARVQLTEVVSGGGGGLSSKLHQPSPHPNQETSASSTRAPGSPQHHSPGTRAPLQGATSNLLQKKAGDCDTSTTVVKAAADVPLPCLSDHSVSVAPLRDASTSPCHPDAVSAGNHLTPSAQTCPQDVPVRSNRATKRSLLRLSLPSQAVLLQSRLLQPCVSLSRLSPQRCHRATDGRSCTYEEPATQRSEEEKCDSSFDLNLLYSSHSSSSGGEDSMLLDPDYKPCIKKKRLLSEYEAARTLM